MSSEFRLQPVCEEDTLKSLSGNANKLLSGRRT